MKLMLKNVRLAFPAIFEPSAVGDGEPAYGAKLIVPPTHEMVAALDDAVIHVAREKWKDKADSILSLLREDKKVCWVKGPYRNKNGEIYDGFEGMYNLSTRNPKTKPSALNRAGSPVTEADGVIYAGCYVHASVEFWAQDNQWGRRINCNLRGVMFHEHGDAFSGGTAASADEFADLAVKGEDLF